MSSVTLKTLNDARDIIQRGGSLEEAINHLQLEGGGWATPEEERKRDRIKRKLERDLAERKLRKSRYAIGGKY